MQYYTTIEQSKKLVELGLNPESADMHYPDYYFDGNAKGSCNTSYKEAIEDLFHVYINPKTKRLLPCWSLGTLIDLLPPSIQTGEGMQNQYEIDIRKYWGNEENLYQIAYGNDRGLSEEWHDMINTGEKESLCDAAFEMVCWLLENGYIKKGE